MSYLAIIERLKKERASNSDYQHEGLAPYEINEKNEKSVPEPPGRAPEDASMPTQRCRTCNGFLFWVSVYGAAICAACHPPAQQHLVRQWFWLPEGEAKKLQ